MACALRENLSNRSSGVQIPRDICTRLERYLYSRKCSWIIIIIIVILLVFSHNYIVEHIYSKIALTTKQFNTKKTLRYSSGEM